jgi:malonyl-CoA/methylmalonyl-CoA synthetase
METLLPLAQEAGIPIHCTTDLLEGDLGSLPEIDPSRNAMILYTSGTTSDPKGVVTTHSNIESQITTLVQAWEWGPDDHILDHLPLHHVHGIINAMACALWVGATCELLPRFDAQNVWNRIADRDLTLYMAVPTVYKALIAAWDEASQADQERWTTGCKAMRLMVSGSDALPVDTFERWEKVSGHRLLERYGMTEIGMALSNPLDGDRIPGQVGTPLPGVDVELIRLDLKKFEETGRRQYGGKVTNRDPGELIIKGPSVFKEYWMKPDMTAEVFDTKGWFYTGDIASLTNEGAYRIWGRASQDLIISGGENVSALEVQRELLKHPDIDACAVVGVEDRFWGRAVSAAIVTVNDSKLDRNSLREWAKARLAPYKVPQNVLILDDLPRNAMGKVLKPQIRTLFDGIES